MFKKGEPLGLSFGSIRALIAIWSAAMITYSYVSRGSLDVEILALCGPYIAYYFGQRGTSDPAPEVDEPLAPPYLGEGKAVDA